MSVASRLETALRSVLTELQLKLKDIEVFFVIQYNTYFFMHLSGITHASIEASTAPVLIM